MKLALNTINPRNLYCSQRIIYEQQNNLSLNTVDFGTLRSFKKQLSLSIFRNFLNV